MYKDSELKQVFPKLPKKVRGALLNATRDTSPAERFGAWCTVMESAFEVLNNLGNSAYLAVVQQTPTDDEHLERFLRQCPKTLTFGTQIDGLMKFIEAGDALALPAFTSLKETRLPQECRRLAPTIRAVKRAREMYSVPSTGIKAYLQDHLDLSRDDGDLAGFFDAARQLRNKGHGHTNDSEWFATDPDFYRMINGLFEPAIVEFLLWNPVATLLGEHVTLRLLDPVKENWKYSQDDLPDNVLVTSTVIAAPADIRPEANLPVVARRTGDLLEIKFRFAKFPASRRSREDLEGEYQRTFFRLLLTGGMVDPDTRSKADAFATRLGLNTQQMPKLEGLGLSRLKKLLEARQNAQYFESVHAELDKGEFLTGTAFASAEALRTKVDELARSQEGTVMFVIEDKSLTSYDEVQKQTGLPDEILGPLMKRLVSEGKVWPVGEKNEELTSGHYTLPNVELQPRLMDILNVLQRESEEEGLLLPNTTWQLVQLCARAIDAASFGAMGAIPINEFERFFDQQSTDESMDAGDELVLDVDVPGGPLMARTVPALCQIVVDWARAQDVHLKVPYRLGRTRFLVNTEATHANGSAFHRPLNIDGLFFEGNIPRETARDALSRLVDESARGTVEPASGDVALAEPVDGESHEIWIELVDESARQWRLSGTSVRRFFASLLRWLLKHRREQLDGALPYRIGRVRLLLAEEPYHDNGRPFRAPVEQDGYFMEAALTHQDAMFYAEMLCTSLGLETLSEVEWEDEESDEPVEEEPSALSVVVGGQEVTGETVKEFFERMVAHALSTGLLADADLPVKAGRVRYLVAQSPRHASGAPFAVEHCIEVGGRKYYIEANYGRPWALKIARSFAEGLDENSTEHS